MKPHAPLSAWFIEATLNLLKILKGILLVVLAIVLISVAIPGAVVWYFCTIWSRKQKARDIMSKSGNFFFLIALALDHLGNVACGGFFNWLFLKDSAKAFSFGVPGQSVSQILGWNYAIGNLNEWGLNLRHDLNTIDPEHCEKAMTAAIFDARHLLDKYRTIQAQVSTIERTREFLAKYN